MTVFINTASYMDDSERVYVCIAAFQRGFKTYMSHPDDEHFYIRWASKPWSKR